MTQQYADQWGGNRIVMKISKFLLTSRRGDFVIEIAFDSRFDSDSSVSLCSE